MRTIYIRRDTEDTDEDMSVIQREVDWFVDGRRAQNGCGGLITVADNLPVEV